MNKYITIIEEYFTEKGLKFFKKENENFHTFFIPMGLKNIPSTIVILEMNDDNKCSAYCTIADGVDTAIQKDLFTKVNRANNDIAFASFSFDKDDDLMVSVNFYLNDHNPGEMAMNYVMVLFNIIDEVAPDFLSSIWALQKEAELIKNFNPIVDESDDLNNLIDEFEDDDDFYDDFDEPDENEDFEFEFLESPFDSEDEDDDSQFEELFQKKTAS